MFKKGKAASLFAAIAGVLLLVASNANANLLGNSSFELPDASGGDAFNGCGGDFAPDWGSFNCNAISSNLFQPGGGFVNPTALTGTQVLKQFGADAGSFQDVAAGEGDTVNASVNAMNWNGDNFNNIFLLQIFALDSNGDNISGGFDPLAQVAAGSDAIVGGSFDYILAGTDGGNDFDWTLMEVAAILPAGTASTRIQLIHILESSTASGGAIFLDDASLTVTPIPVPAAVWLFGSALGLLGWARRRAT